MRTKRKDPNRHVGKIRINQEIVKFLEYKDRSNRGLYPVYEILCHNCGHTYISFYYTFADSRKTGKCCRKCSNKENRNYEAMSASDTQVSINFSNYKAKCKIKNWQFDLTKEEFKKYVKSNCHYCDQEPNQNRLDRVKNRRLVESSFLMNGIDRLDSSVGYTIKNCVSCCEDCNKAKRNLGYTQFLNLIKKIYEFKKL